MRNDEEHQKRGRRTLNGLTTVIGVAPRRVDVVVAEQAESDGELLAVPELDVPRDTQHPPYERFVVVAEEVLRG